MIHKNEYCKRRHRSIFVKLLFVLFGTMFIIHFIIGGLFSFLFGRRSVRPLINNIQQYANYIIQDIGSPPDTVRVREIVKRSDIQIRYEGPAFIWSSSASLPSIDEVDHRIKQRKLGSGPGKILKRYHIVSFDKDSKFLFKWGFGPYVDMHRQIFLFLLLIITLTFIGANIFIRRILRPIRWLRRGVNDISQGNLDINIPIRKRDELGCLTEAINDMAKRIKEMIQSRDQLLLDVSHELRSPITRIKVALEFIPESEKKESLINDLTEIEIMITEILESERFRNGRETLILIQTNLVTLISEVGQEFIKRSPHLEYHGFEKPCTIILDAERMKIVFRNIIENSLKYSKPDSPPIKISLIDGEHSVTIQIKDSGSGIPKEELPYIFEPFYRVDRSRSKKIGGYGLGLHISKKIIKAHQGSINIRNNPDRGVLITLTLKKRI